MKPTKAMKPPFVPFRARRGPIDPEKRARQLQDWLVKDLQLCRTETERALVGAMLQDMNATVRRVVECG